MNPMIRRENNSVTLDLTKPILVWVGVFGALAAAFQSWTLLWVALGPVIIVAGFSAVFFAFMVIIMAVWYASGKPITLTSRKGSRVIQRGR